MALASLSPAELVVRCRAGDQDAWRELVGRFARYVYAISVQAYRLSEQDAEEVFQETFTRTYENLDRLRDDDAIRQWLGQVTRRLAIDRLRVSARESLSGEPVEPRDADETLVLLDDALTVHEALAGLSPECREVLERFYIRDQSYRAIAEALGLPAGTIASRVSRCLGKLRAELEGSGLSRPPS
jgi:RNA polymerase sigma factor (sigma-70 family)